MCPPADNRPWYSRNVKRSALLLVLGLALLSGCHEPRTAANLNIIPVNLPAEIDRARAEKKLVLIEFGSSDSCPPCTLLERNVFSKPEFMSYAAANLVFVRLDFPFRTDLPPATQATNDLLAKQYSVGKFPTFIALDAAGKEFWRMPAKNEIELDERLFEPRTVIELIESIKKKRS